MEPLPRTPGDPDVHPSTSSPTRQSDAAPGEVALPATGERTVPGLPREQYFFARHEAVYAWIAAEFSQEIRDAVVLDAGSGEGYGTAMLAAADARACIAIEYDDAAARHSARAYPVISVVRANLADLPLGAGSCDVIVCLQVIEHLWNLTEFLTDLRRVTRPGGLAILSTPNRPVFSPSLGRGQRPTNPFHVEEFDAEQLHDLMKAAGWSGPQVLGVHHGARIAAWEADYGDLVAAQIAAITSSADTGSSWPDDLESFIADLTAADFLIERQAHRSTDRSQDLIAIARAPA
jgi:SAM-dependent methyltransferase